MYFERFQNANASTISVTGTATDVFDLINTAGGTTLVRAGFSSKVNGLIIHPENGDVRMLFDGNTPTASKGFLVRQGTIGTFANVPLDKLKLIRTGSTNVTCSLHIGICDSSEGISLSAGSNVIFPSGANQQDAASSSSADTVAADTTAGGTQIVAANANRYFTQCQNNGAADVYFGAGTVTSDFPKVVPGGTFTWHSQEELKVLASSGSCNIAFIDYINS